MLKKILIDNKFIYYKLHENTISDKLVIIISGLSGEMESNLIKKSYSYFKKNNNVININFCADIKFKKKNIFNIKDLNKNIYLKAIEIIIKLNKKNNKIILIGHSFAAPLNLMFCIENKYLNIKIIMWDPTIIKELFNYVKSYAILDSKYNIYFFSEADREKNFVFSDKLLSSFTIKDPLECTNLIKNKLLIVSADKGAKKNSIKYYNKNPKKVIYKNILNTGHLFGTNKAKKELFKITENFINAV